MIAPELLLVGAVAAVGVLHTVVPDHWAPIALIARQQRWTQSQTARAALQAGIGHVVTTLLIALVVWIAGTAFAVRFGSIVASVSSVALVCFGGWIAIASLLELRTADVAFAGEAAPVRVVTQPEQRPGGSRTALLLILGSSPMIEGIPAFFAASRYGWELLCIMATVFATATIATYVLLCVTATASLRRLRFGAFERYGEVISGAFVALIGIVFFIWPVL